MLKKLFPVTILKIKQITETVNVSIWMCTTEVLEKALVISKATTTKKTTDKFKSKKKTVDSAQMWLERLSKHCSAQCLACRREQFPVGQRTLPVPTHVSDTQPAMYFLYNRKWDRFCSEVWGWVAKLGYRAKRNVYLSRDRILLLF